MNCINSLGIKELSGKRVLVRADFNIPVKDGKIVDNFRLKELVPTVNHLLTAGAHVSILPHGDTGKDSLGVQSKAFLELLFPGRVTILPNVRRDAREMNLSDAYARDLSRGYDLYVNEAFSASHRVHTSVVLIPKILPAYAGIRFSHEVARLSELFTPDSPFVVIMGGYKFETKMPLMQKILPAAATLFVGGALCVDLYRAKGYEIGRSKTGTLTEEIARLLENKKLILPPDVWVETKDGGRAVRQASRVLADDRIADIGPAAQALLPHLLKTAKTVFWNGPMGDYENGFVSGSDAVVRSIVQSYARSYAGGGDTVQAIEKRKAMKAFSFISTGGGASLQFLAEHTLPGIQALEQTLPVVKKPQQSVPRGTTNGLRSFLERFV